MNKVFLIGNIANDLELTKTASDKSLCHFRLAVRKEYKVAEGEPDADFISCTAFDQQAESLTTYCAKGRKIAIEGTVHPYTVEKDGFKQYKQDINVKRIEFVDSPKKDGGNGLPASSAASAPAADDGELPF